MKILKLIELDVTILKHLIKNGSSNPKLILNEIREYNKKTNKYKFGMAYNNFMKRVHFLNSTSFIKITKSKPLQISINKKREKAIVNYVSTIFTMEELIDGDSNV